jgi:hypothetical protein
MLKKVPPFCSVAQALARKVLPVPGGCMKKEIPHRAECLSKVFAAQRRLLEISWAI